MQRHRPPHPCPQPGVRCPAGERGLTVLELMMSIVITGVVLLGGVTLLRSVSGAQQTIGKGLESTSNALDVLAALRADFNQCRVESISSDHASVTYSLPMRAGDDGSTFDTSGEPIWEVTEVVEGVPVTTRRLVTLRFEVERLVKESSLGRDINRDGDKDDVFDVGRLTKTSSMEGRRAMPLLYIALKNGDHGGDVSGDGQADPLFFLEPGTTELEISMFRIIGNESLRPTISHCAVMESNL